MSHPDKENNRAEGRESYDSKIGDSVVEFFNRNVSPYPTDVGGPSFDLIPIEKQKDIMVNVARMHGHQEYNRIMQLVEVLQQQAASIKRRLDITDMVHAAKYQFQIYHGQSYWLAVDHRKGGTVLTHTGPADWTTGGPSEYEYICRVKWLGDYTWVEVDDKGNECF